MKVDKYKVYCSSCKDSSFVDKHDVEITLDFEDNRYHIKTFCPRCGSSIYIVREAFPR